MKNPYTDLLKPLNILALGAGVQSTALALMSEKKELPKVDAAIFADTGGEPKSVMKHLDWLESELSYPVYRVMEKDGLTNAIYEAVEDKTKRLSAPPFYTKGERSKVGKLFRVCTSEYKIKPVIQKIRELLGLKKGERAGKEIRVIQWFGISYDELQRMKESKHKWLQHYYPLIEKKITRQDCLNWMQRNGYPEPPRSACTYCPYHSDSFWRTMKYEDTESWTDAVNVDHAIRAGIRGTTNELYLHKSLQPLDEVKFEDEYHPDQETFSFGDECEGMCGN